MNGTNYDALLNGFNSGTVTGISLGATGISYCSANAARANLTTTGIGNKNWTITDEGVASNTTIVTQPISTTSCSGVLASFVVSATGGNLKYAWSNGLSTNNTMRTSVTGTNYIVTVSGSCGASQTGNAVSLANYLSTSIATQPISTTSCSGVLASFVVSATGGNLKYAWSNGLSTLTSMNTSVTGSNYMVTVSGLCGSSQVSNAVSLSNYLPTSIVSQPISTTSCSGVLASFMVSATGTNLNYAWSNGLSTNNMMSTSVVGSNYVVTVSGLCGSSQVSNAVSLTGIALTSIQPLPAVATICSGLTLPLVATAIGSNLVYAWSTGISGASATVSTSGTYMVTVTGTCGAKVSNAVEVTVSDCNTVTIPGTSTGLNTLESHSTFSIYPNPNAGTFLIDLQGFQNLGGLAYTISSIEGKVVATGTLNKGKNEVSTSFIKEIYFVKVGNGVRKLVIE